MKIDLIYQQTECFDDKSINKISTEEYPDLNQNELIELIDSIIFDSFTSHNIHLSDERKRTYRIDNTVMTINQLKNFIKIEEDKLKFIKKVKSDINNSNQQTFDFIKNNINCTSIEYDIPNEWVYHHGGNCDYNRYKIMINIYF